MTENKTPAAQQDVRAAAQKIADLFLPQLAQQLPLDSYQTLCVKNALWVMNDVAHGAELENVSKFSRTEVMEILHQIAVLRLNAFAMPRECYFQTRKKKKPDGKWGISIEMGVEGDGNDAILRHYGHNIDTVYNFWAVREDDEFTYPTYCGVDVTPPVWTPCGKGRYARAVYPIKFKDGTIRYFIGERSDVRINLVAHISNNMMNETFGITESRYKATVEQKREIDARKAELKALMDGKDIDEILDIPELQPYISPAWREGSRERMILRKMRNNAVKPVPKDFASGMAMEMYRAGTKDDDVIDVEFSEIDFAPETVPDILPSAAAHETIPEPPAAVPERQPQAAPAAVPASAPQAAPF